MLFEVSNLKHSNPIWFGGRGKWIQFSHADNNAMRFSLLDQVSKRVGFPHPWILFFQ